MNDLKIGWKYGIALGITIVLFCISAVFVYIQVGNVKGNIGEIEFAGDNAIKMTEMASLYRSKDILIADYINSPSEEIIQEFQKQREEFNRLEEQLKEQIKTKDQIMYFDLIVDYDKKTNEIFLNEIVPAVKSGNNPAVVMGRKRTQSFRSPTVIYLGELREMVKNDRQQAISAAKERLDQSINILILSILISALLGSIVVFFGNRMVQKNLNKVLTMAHEISNQNLNIKENTYKGKDEIGQLSQTMNTMLVSLREMVIRIGGVSEQVSTQSEELTQSANEVREGSSQVAATMQELSVGSDSQANASSNLSESMRGFMEKVEEANLDGEHIHKSSSEILELTNNGAELMELSIHQMSEINRIVKEAVNKVQGLDHQSKEISKLVAVIQNIADQTNLLALNATIEAARAGEHGKGFSVVAGEVLKLAEQVSQSVTNITEIVKGIQSESNHVVTSLKTGYQEVEKGTEQIHITGETFEHIKQSVSDMVERIKNISGNLTHIVSSGQEINVSIENIASISEESAAGIEQTSASIEQTSASMEEVAKSAGELSNLAEDLNEMVRKFKL